MKPYTKEEVIRRLTNKLMMRKLSRELASRFVSDNPEIIYTLMSLQLSYIEAVRGLPDGKVHAFLGRQSQLNNFMDEELKTIVKESADKIRGLRLS